MILTLASLKGGVGKSALSVSISNEVSKREKVLAIDLDPQASLTDFYLGDSDRVSQIMSLNIFHYLMDERTLEEVTYRERMNLDCIPSALNLAQIGAVKSGDPGAILTQKAEIREMSEDYPLIVIDCPPSPSYEFRLGISSADLVLVPLSTDRWSLQGLTLLIKETTKLRKSGLFTGEIAVIPSLCSSKDAELIRDKVQGVRVLSSEFLRMASIKRRMDRGAETKLDKIQKADEMIQAIVKELEL